MWSSSFFADAFHLALLGPLLLSVEAKPVKNDGIREKISINAGWRFSRSEFNTDKLAYDLSRTDYANRTDLTVLKPWVMPSANDFIVDPAARYQPPSTEPNISCPFVQSSFDDSSWESVNLPHDWAIKGPFYVGDNVPVSGGMGRLPVQGVGWYRRKLQMTEADEGKSVYLDIDGAMSYSIVWLNGHLVGGWPYGYSSYQLDLTPHLKLGDDNLLAIRVDNPGNSSRWYPGGGIYRNVWLTKTSPTHVGQWGTFITSKNVSKSSAVLDLTVEVENSGNASQTLSVVTDVYVLDTATGAAGRQVASFPRQTVTVAGGQKASVNASTTVNKPALWGPPPSQSPNMHVAVTRLYNRHNDVVDTYSTNFGIRSVVYDSNHGLLVNGELIRIRGVNGHHDLGSLGAAFNERAAQRQLEVLQELGCNALRTSHNPPAPELLDLADKMGILVYEEAFDCWQLGKNPNDFHLIFDEWSEADVRTMLRRDRNHPSVIIWSIGNEVGEQTTGATGAAVAKRLREIVHSEDVTRPVTASMNAARPDMPFPGELDLVSLNYQGEGIRDTGPYAGLPGISTSPLYYAFHDAFPDKLVLSSETAATLSTRGTYFFPVTNWTSAPENYTLGSGGNDTLLEVSDYGLYTAPFGSSPDKVFVAQDNASFVGGEFVWSGWDYIGEPTPYYEARSSYYGIIDLAGFGKDRFFEYQSRWRPDLPVAHILPHWTWPDRVGQVTPVHVFSNGDEAELWVNGRSQGRLRRASASVYRFRWDNVTYHAGEVRVVAYKNGKPWASDRVVTAGAPAALRLSADRSAISGDGLDLSFLTATVVDGKGNVVPAADNEITFSVSGGGGELVATDNGDPRDFTSFASATRKAFSGRALAVVRANGQGAITVTASSAGLARAVVRLTAH
ncbi:glycoside hydrolase family 2 protein [Thermothielavioides terrestris NRRL 8126]|uniref:Glycoside hydrolase family 2 protein n=1 Tax=Thermothielavioides terrestris (strain ATCC 38088 / NRRL 8126) TaxID=578455 RepID=G2QV90_THETT|nr:glycoside hydrolase family 2 protein [Thermothielavioides terrestris NRRL 8126]AEO63777.1 glycoside hydrolase family 2 protein [Thermothielavioides terrestris NRRL 8126]